MLVVDWFLYFMIFIASYIYVIFELNYETNLFKDKIKHKLVSFPDCIDVFILIPVGAIIFIIPRLIKIIRGINDDIKKKHLHKAS